MSVITLVTGGSRGLGRNTALYLAQSGSDVIITYQKQEAEAKKVVEEIQASGRKAIALQLNAAVVKSFVFEAGRKY